ncbi:MAG: hypothetical protein HQL20_05540 [Candidatus Omnitrophica bacterium]|nr:hypothetical protein [Candidatus Omnitrophota bacterium]
MIVEVFSLCDAATSDGGKLNILGSFDVIRVQKLPAVLAHCSIAIRLRFFALEKGDHHIEVRFIDADGQGIIPPSAGSVKVDFSSEQRSAAFNLVLNIPGLKIDKAGEYALELRVAGQVVISLPLDVRLQ